MAYLFYMLFFKIYKLSLILLVYILLNMGNCIGRDDCTTAYKSIHEITVKSLEGEKVPLENFKGKVLLVVNVASRCGLADKYYSELVQLDLKYSKRGLVILAFPCNQFLWEECGSPAEIRSFASANRANFLLCEKTDVNGKHSNELYKYLRKNSELQESKIGWNFGKFLVSKEGTQINYFGPKVNPASLEPNIEKLL